MNQFAFVRNVVFGIFACAYLIQTLREPRCRYQTSNGFVKSARAARKIPLAWRLILWVTQSLRSLDKCLLGAGSRCVRR